MQFVIDDRLVLPEITSGYDSWGRWYETPEGIRYPSVTTVLGHYNKEALDKWREEVGEEFANRVSQRAAARGTRAHTYAEEYIRGNKFDILGYADSEMFGKLQRALDANLGVVYVLERPLYSHTMRMAGRSDIIGEWKATPSIIDIKTSLREKYEVEIPQYFAQTAAYALMVKELTGMTIKNLVICMLSDDQKEAVVYVRRLTAKYIQYLADARVNFDKLIEAANEAA